MGYHDRDGQGILLIIGITFRLTLGADMYTDLLARLTAEHSARLRAIDAVWAPLPVPSVSPGTVVVPARANAAAVVTTSTFAADTPATMWATRVCHDITLRVGAAATDSDVVETLRLAISEARATTPARPAPTALSLTTTAASAWSFPPATPNSPPQPLEPDFDSWPWTVSNNSLPSQIHPYTLRIPPGRARQSSSSTPLAPTTSTR